MDPYQPGGHRSPAETRPPRRNSFGRASLVSGLIAIPFALIPIIGDFIAVPAAVLAIAFGFVGLDRVESGKASGRVQAIAGGILGLAAMILLLLTVAATLT